MEGGGEEMEENNWGKGEQRWNGGRKGRRLDREGRERWGKEERGGRKGLM